MPLDSINPLMSALGTLGPAMWMPPVPDGPGIDLADRQQLSGTYSGLLAQGAEYEGSIAFAGGAAAVAFAGTFSPAGAGEIAFAGGVGVLSLAGTASYEGSVGFAGGAGSLALAGTASYAGSAGFVGGVGVLSLAGTFTSAGSGAMAFAGGPGALALAGTASYVGSVALAGGAGVLALAGTASYAGSLAFAAGPGVLSLAGSEEEAEFAGIALAGGPGVLALAGTASYAGSLAFAGGPATFTITTDGFELEPADSLLTAIWRFADADAVLETAFGREGWLWKNKAPRGATLPYAVVFEAGSSARTGTGETYHEVILIQFNVFATSEVQAKRLGDLVSDTFAPYAGQEEMVFEGGTDLDRWIEDGNVLERDFGRGRGGVPVYVQRVNYGWRIGRSYAPA